MEILGIGPLEALFILLIALIAVGPKDLGKAARSMGRLLNQLYKSEAWSSLSEASRNLRTLPNRMAREAALEELAQVKREMEEDVTSGIDQLKDFGQPLDPAPRPATDQRQDTGSAPDPAEAAQPNDGSSETDHTGTEQSADGASASDPPDHSPEEN
jgi:sec-independent protein translocase protein TatB